MKYGIIFLILVWSFASQSTYATTGSTNVSTTLKPSLTLQMKKNTLHLKKYTKEIKVIGNQQRLASIRSKNKNTSPNQTTEGTSIQVVSTLKTVSPTPKIQLSSAPVYRVSDTIIGVDINQVRTTWLSWYNATRSSLGLNPYSYDTRIDATAHDWNIIFAEGR